MRIFAVLDMVSFGDFVSSLFVVNSIADRFDHRMVTLLYRHAPAYQSDMARLLPGANYIEVPADAPLPSIDIVTAPTRLKQIDPQFEDWFKGGFSSQDLFITSDMALSGYLWCFDHLSHLRIPEGWVSPCTEELVRRGLDRSKWFCTIHAREPGYNGKPDERNLRDCDSMLYWAVTAHVIQELGGQVVRLGHPTMTPWPGLKGLVDLSREPDNSKLQAFALSRSRFLFSGPSGPSALADALNVPAAMADAVEYGGLGNERMVMRTVDFTTPEGRLYRQGELFEAGYHKMRILQLLKHGQGYRVIKNGLPEMMRLAGFLHAMTDDVSAWRIPAKPKAWVRPNQLLWPPGEPRLRSQFLPD